MEETIQQLVKMVMDTAPELWRIARTQVNVQIGMATLWIIVCTVLLACLTVIAKYMIKPNPCFYPAEKREEQAQMDFYMTEACFIVLYIIVVIFAFTTIVPRIINPDWYAIEVLRSLIR